MSHQYWRLRATCPPAASRYILAATIIFALQTAFVVAGKEEARCRAVRTTMVRAADEALGYYTMSHPTGALQAASRDDVRKRALGAVHNVTLALADVNEHGGFERCLPEAGSDRTAAQISYALLDMLLRGRPKARERLRTLEPFGTGVPDLFSDSLSWSELVHSGWPVFRLAAVIESESRSPLTTPLLGMRLDVQDASEGCPYNHEEVGHLMVLVAGEGITARINDVRDFLRNNFEGEQTTETRFLLDILYAQPASSSCQAVLAVVYAALADALQCHWKRPRSRATHIFADAVLDRAQKFAAIAFTGEGAEARSGFTWGAGPLKDATPMATFFSSRWPVLSFLARLEPRRLPKQQPLGGQEAEWPAVVSWSTREEELGGMNWAERFAAEVFGDLPGIELVADLECADIYVYRSKRPVNFGGVLIFVDGEKDPGDSEQDELLEKYPASIVVGPQPASGNTALHFAVPYAALSFAGRQHHSPDLLSAPWRARDSTARAMANGGLAVHPAPERRFAAYLAFKCWPHRERFFSLLSDAARSRGLTGVDTLSRCGDSDASEGDRRQDRYSQNYMDDAVALFSHYKFALVFENHMSPRYVTEKIANAYLAGAVPIFWGSPFVLQVFDPRSFIRVNSFDNFEAAAKHVVDVALDPVAYKAYLQAPVLRAEGNASWYFSWHRDMSAPDGRPSLREQLAEAALEKHRAGIGGVMPAIERRPWYYAELFR